MKYVNFRWPAVQAALSIRNVRFLLKKIGGINKNIGYCHKYRIISVVQKYICNKKVLVIQNVLTSQTNLTPLIVFLCLT
jgi:hypothetical protein